MKRRRAAKHVFPGEVQKRMIFKVFGFGESDPTSHADFENTKVHY